jgi:hypothetical protein
MAERIELWEWASQKSDEEFARFFCAIQGFGDSKQVSDGDDAEPKDRSAPLSQSVTSFRSLRRPETSSWDDRQGQSHACSGEGVEESDQILKGTDQTGSTLPLCREQPVVCCWASISDQLFDMNQVWVNVNTELPPDGWTGTIKVRFPSYVSEMVAVVFQKKNPMTGAENDFTYQHGTVDGKTGEWLTPPGTVTHWFKLVDE